MYVVYCNRHVSINWWPFCLNFVLQTCIICVSRWLIFISSNHNSSLCHHMYNNVQYRATTCSPQFVVGYWGWQYVDSGSTLKQHIIGNFSLYSTMGVNKWGLWCIRVWLYFTCCLCKTKLLGIVSVGFDKIGQLLNIYFGFVRYLKKTKGIQWGSA
jgi:hypothetical protein